MTDKLPRCPFRMAGFDQPDTCDINCAWLMDDIEDGYKACAISVIALNTGVQLYEGDKNTFVIKNEIKP